MGMAVGISYVLPYLQTRFRYPRSRKSGVDDASFRFSEGLVP